MIDRSKDWMKGFGIGGAIGAGLGLAIVFFPVLLLCFVGSEFHKGRGRLLLLVIFTCPGGFLLGGLAGIIIAVATNGQKNAGRREKRAHDSGAYDDRDR